MPSGEPRNITPDLKRSTVSAHELASLGWLHGTVGRLRKSLGMSYAYQTGEFTWPGGRLDTGSLQIRQEWPRDLVKLGVAILAGAAIMIVLATGGGQPEPENEPAAAVLLAPDQPGVPAPEPLIESSGPEMPQKAAPPKVKKVRNKRTGKKARRVKKKKHRRH